MTRQRKVEVGSGTGRSPTNGTDARDHRWAIVLAGGEGSRLSGLTRDLHGVPVPKQFCSLNGASTLLHDALARASAVAPPERTVVIVAAHQARYWQSQLSSLPAANIVVQPRNRGTAIGVLLPTLHILARDPEARIVCLPSDHFVADESILAQAIDAALSDLEHSPGKITFLGIEPEEADPGLGYIAPSVPAAGTSAPIARFIEKPEVAVARRLIEQGALWNSFIFAARGSAVVRLVQSRYPRAVGDIALALGQSDVLARVYDELPPIDFSRDIVEGAEPELRVRAVPACGWSDLGTPQRLGECIDRFQLDRRNVARKAFRHDVINLAEAYRGFVSGPALGSIA